MAARQAELDNFLQNVDELEAIVKGLASSDVSLSKDAISKADKLIEKQNVDQAKKEPKDNTGVNRTVINHKAFQDDISVSNPPCANNMDTNEFMTAMAQDAEDRAKRRGIREKEATQLKLKGNQQFAAGEYDKAIEFYDQAVQLVRDMTVLYTNRAQALIKLSKYDKAIEDCDWALRVSEKCVKAYVHKGRAYLGLKQYNMAIESYQQALKVDPSKEALIKGYIDEVELAAQTDREEQVARLAFDNGDHTTLGIISLIDKIQQPDRSALYYSGGLKIIADVLKNTNDCTIFRTHGGLELTQTHPVISKCYATCPSRLSKEDLDLCASVLTTFSAACRGSEENQKRLLEVNNLPSQLARFLSVSLKSVRIVREQTMKLLHQISETQVGRSAIVQQFDANSLLMNLFHLMRLKSSIAVTSVKILNNILLVNRFKSQLHKHFKETILPAFQHLLGGGYRNLLVLPPCISTIGSLCNDTCIRQELSQHEPTWKASQQLLEQYSGVNEDITYAILGLLCNIGHDSSALRDSYAQPLTAVCLPLVTSQHLRLRVTALLSKLMQHSEQATLHVCQPDGAGVLHFLNILQSTDEDEEVLKQTSKCLAACTQYSQQARNMFLGNNGLEMLLGLLKATDEIIVGNAALSLTHLCDEPGVCSRLVDTDIVMTILVTARDGRRHAAQKNCAVLVAKLATGDQRHLERLRELHGLEILHDVLKHAPKSAT